MFYRIKTSNKNYIGISPGLRFKVENSVSNGTEKFEDEKHFDYHWAPF